MQVIILPTASEVGEFAAAQIAPGIETGKIRVLGVATGSSPLTTYQALARRSTDAMRNLTVFALDEYVGLPYSHPESYHAVIDRHVREPLGLDAERVHVPDGFADDLDAAAALYEESIRDAGGVDLQILGIGRTGHIGFNEPSSSLGSRTRVKTLTPETRLDNARFFDDPKDVPYHCITQGLGTILDARSIILVANGKAKAKAIASMVEGPVSAMCPGSALQFHPDVTVVVDEEAASELTMTEYYQFILDNLPT